MLSFLLAGMTGTGARDASAASTHPSRTVIAQADPSGSQVDPAGDDTTEEDVPIPPNLLEPGPAPAPSDTTGAPAARTDSTAAPAVRSDSTSAPGGSIPTRADSARSAVPFTPAQTETLFSVPPGVKTGGGKPSVKDPVVVPKRSGGILGLTPVVVLLSLAVVHILVLRAVD